MSSLSRFMDALKTAGWNVDISVVQLKLTLPDGKYHESLAHNPQPVFSEVNSFRGRKNRRVHDVTADVYKVEASAPIYSLDHVRAHTQTGLSYKGEGELTAYFLYGPGTFISSKSNASYNLTLSSHTFSSYLEVVDIYGPITCKAHFQKTLSHSKDVHEGAIKRATTKAQDSTYYIEAAIKSYAQTLGIDPQLINANLPALETVAEVLLSNKKDSSVDLEPRKSALLAINNTLANLQNIESLTELTVPS